MYLIRTSNFFPVALSFLLAQALADQVCPIEGPSIPYGTASSFDGTIAVGTEVMFTCLSDWMTTMSSVCEPTGAWSDPIGTCPETCSMYGPEGPEGTMSSFDGTNAIGTKVTFTCKNDGYTMFYSECDEHGSWTPVYGTCSCPGSGPMVPYGMIRYMFDGANSIGTRVTVMCVKDMATMFYSECMSDGSWSYINGSCPVDACSKDGPYGPMGTTSSFDGTNTIGTNVTFTCMNDGTTMFYSHCDEYGSWTPVNGMCSCPSSGPMVRDNMISMFDGTNTVGTMVDVTCVNDRGTMFYSECMSDGSWSYINESCPITCSMYGPDYPMGTSSSFDGTNNVGTTVTFLCLNDGKTMLYSHCDENGSWTPVNGVCSCPYPKDVMPHNAFGSFADSYPIGTDISFTCSTDLTAQVYSKCQSDGTWSPIDDACPTPCPPNPMGPLDTTSSFGGDNRIGASVSFTCNSVDSLMFYSQCQSDGTWSSIDETCPGGSAPIVKAIQGMNVLSDVNPCMYITSPSWPNNYASTNIVWMFESHATSDCSNPMLETIFDPVFNIIGSKKKCKGDKLKMPYPNKKGNKDFCGNKAPVVPPTPFPSGDVLSFNFNADLYDSGKGFKATVCLKCESSL